MTPERESHRVSDKLHGKIGKSDFPLWAGEILLLRTKI